MGNVIPFDEESGILLDELDELMDEFAEGEAGEDWTMQQMQKNHNDWRDVLCAARVRRNKAPQYVAIVHSMFKTTYRFTGWAEMEDE